MSIVSGVLKAVSAGAGGLASAISKDKKAGGPAKRKEKKKKSIFRSIEQDEQMDEMGFA